MRAAIERHRRGLDADAAGYLHAHEVELDDAWRRTPRRATSACRRSDLAFTDSTTMGLGLVYGGIQVDGDVVATEHDFYATHEALRLRFGRCRRIRLYDDPAQATRRLDRRARSRRARRGAGLLALTWVHSSTGVRLPIREIAAARPKDTLMVVDGVHGLAAVDEPIDAGDVFVAGTPQVAGRPARHRASCGAAPGTGCKPTIPTFTPGSPALDLHPRRLPQLRAPLGAGRGVRDPSARRPADRRAGHAPQGGPRRLPKVRLVTPMSPELSAGIVCFEVDG